MKNVVIPLLGVAIFTSVLAGFGAYGYFVIEDNRREPGHDDGYAKVVSPSDPDVAIIMHCMEEKYQVAGEWIEGTITLPEAAARFRLINQSRPTHLPSPQPKIPGKSEEELMCRQVLGYAQGLLEGRSDARAILAIREAELQDYLAEIDSAQTSDKFTSPVPIPSR